MPAKDKDTKQDLTIGTILKNARTKGKIKILDVVKSLKVKEQDIIDLENDKIYDRKSSFYTHGLIRSYGNFLKIDNQIITEKVNALKDKNAKLGKYKLINIDKDNKYLPSQKYVTYAILFLIIIYLISFCDFGIDRDVDSDFIIERIK